MALSVVYFRITQTTLCVGRVSTVFSVGLLEKVEVRVTVIVTAAHSLIFSKSTKGPPVLTSPPSSEVENFQMKNYYLAGNLTPDLLNQRQTCYHLSQRGELV